MNVPAVQLRSICNGKTLLFHKVYRDTGEESRDIKGRSIPLNRSRVWADANLTISHRLVA